MAHGHHHHHHHDHKDSHNHQQTIQRLKLAFVLNLVFAIIELVGGMLTNSLAITSDALHDFGDAVALGLALYFEKLSQQKSDQKYTYGYRRLSSMSAVITGLILIFGSMWIIKESINRWTEVQEPHSLGMIGLAILGVIVNGYAALKVSKGHSHNEKMIQWHLIEDVLGWIIVLIGAIAIKIFDWPQLDGILAVMLSSWVIYNVFKNLKHSLSVFLQAIPSGINIETIRSSLLKMEGVKDVHHMHVWTLDGEKHILTTHVQVDPNTNTATADELKKKIKTYLLDHGIDEATIELEWSVVNCIDPHHHN